jgi:hypothetical protein
MEANFISRSPHQTLITLCAISSLSRRPDHKIDARSCKFDWFSAQL